MIKRLLTCFLLFFHTFVQAQIPSPYPDVSQDSALGCKNFKLFATKQLSLGGAYLANSPQDFSHHSSHSESDGWFSSSSEDVSYTAQTTRRNVLVVEAATLSASRFVDRGGDYGGHAHATSPRAQIEAVIDTLERVESSTDSNLFFKSGESRGDIRHTPVFTKFKNLTLSTAHAHLDAPPGQGKPQGLTLVPFNPASLQVPQVEALLEDFCALDSRLRGNDMGRGVDNAGVGGWELAPLFVIPAQAGIHPAPSHAMPASSFVIPAPSHAIPASSFVIPAEAGIHPSPKDPAEQELPRSPQLHINPVGETHEQWDRSTFSLTPGFAAVLALAVTIATGVAAGPAAQAAKALGFGTEGVVFMAAKAGVQAVASATVVGTVNHQGNAGRAVEDLGKPDSLRSIAASMVTAGLVENVTQTLKLPDAPKTFGEHFQKAAIKAAVSVPVEATLGGQTFEKALISGATTFAADTLGGVASQHLGEARLEGLGFLEHKLAHGLVGAATGAILNLDDPGRGAAAGALGQAMAETLAEWQLGVPEMLAKKGSLKPSDVPSDGQIQQAHDLSKLSAAAMALVLRQDVGTAIHTADTALENNSKGVLAELKRAGWSTLVQTSPFAKEVDEDLTHALEKAHEQGFSALTAYEKGLFCAFVSGEALCLMSDATMAMVDEHITQGKLGEAEAIVASFAREVATLAEKNTLELGFSEDAAKAAGLFVANIAKNLQHARPGAKGAAKKIAEPEPKFSKLTGPIKGSRVEKELHPRVRLINNQKPKNYEYAGKTYPLEKLPEELRQKYPHSVPFTGTGHPDFSRYAVKKVEITFSGDTQKDMRIANKIANYTSTPEGYTW
ncbi:MAG: DUF637 domain-containing protein, partial [Alphaproteobacteria bacterium]